MFENSQYLINASNLHVGGGVQVATSVIGELSICKNLPAGLAIWASSEVHQNLMLLGYDVSRFPSYEVIDSYGMDFIFSSLSSRIQKFRSVFTIFGPLYALKLRGKNITGFAQGWIIYPKNDGVGNFSFLRNLLNKLKYKIQTIFFKRADLLVVELEHVREMIVKLKIKERDKVEIIHNCLSSIYTNQNLWQSLEVPDVLSDFRIGFVGRNYSHKNTRIFPEIKRILKLRFGIEVSFFVTFNDSEWRACDLDFRSSVVNVGSIFVSQCPSFYKKMDAVIFPSLLECFSATPLEAMAMKRPLFASDRPFNRDICGDYAIYFDPLNPLDAANAIASYFTSKSNGNHILQSNLKMAQAHALSFSNAGLRADRYLKLLISKGDEMVNLEGCKNV
jgi:glycosyltransferase involved in cell wall biosynthesis